MSTFLRLEDLNEAYMEATKKLSNDVEKESVKEEPRRPLELPAPPGIQFEVKKEERDGRYWRRGRVGDWITTGAAAVAEGFGPLEVNEHEDLMPAVGSKIDAQRAYHIEKKREAIKDKRQAVADYYEAAAISGPMGVLPGYGRAYNWESVDPCNCVLPGYGARNEILGYERKVITPEDLLRERFVLVEFLQEGSYRIGQVVMVSPNFLRPSVKTLSSVNLSKEEIKKECHYQKKGFNLNCSHAYHPSHLVRLVPENS